MSPWSSALGAGTLFLASACGSGAGATRSADASRDVDGAASGGNAGAGGASGATGGGSNGGNGGGSSSGGAPARDASAGGSMELADAAAGGSDSSAPERAPLRPFAVGSHWNELSKFAALRAAGVQMIRIDVSWNHVEPSPGVFDWPKIDAAMAEAAKQGIEVLAIVGYTNDWASSRDGGTGGTQQHAPREEYDDAWGRFVQEVVARYADQVAAWEIWNEPDHDNFLRLGTGTWAQNHYPSESPVNQKRLEYKHLLDIALSQPALAGKRITTSGFAEGGGYDTGMRAWLTEQPGFFDQFDVASFHCYGYPSYQRLIDVPASYRETQSAIGKATWPFWITEHGINTTGVPAGAVKTYLIRTFATALSQPGVEKLFWFRAGFDPNHMDLFDAAGNTTAAYDAFKTLTTMWTNPEKIEVWRSDGSARGAVATLSMGYRMAIVWNDGAGVPLDALGLAIDAAYDQDGQPFATDGTLAAAPVFAALTD